MQTIIKILFCWWGGHPSGCTSTGLDFHHMVAHYECHACGHTWQKKLTAEVAAKATKRGRKIW